MIQWLKQLFKKEIPPEPIVEGVIVEEEMVKEEIIETEPAIECYTRSDMFLFSGYLMGKKESDPGMKPSEVFEEWKLRFKTKQDE